MYYKVCPDCGAHLDPGERCDCQNEEKAARCCEHQTAKGKARGRAVSAFIVRPGKGGCQG